MKKTIVTIAIVLGLGIGSYAQAFLGSEADDSQDYGLFGFVKDGIFLRETGGEEEIPGLPDFEQEGDQDAPLGSGIAVLAGLGAAYLVGKKRREE
jgi:hypothetical protein